MSQPPSGGCVLKPPTSAQRRAKKSQPPSGGCVLKRRISPGLYRLTIPAAFRRLCVETSIRRTPRFVLPPAAFRRLCVETVIRVKPKLAGEPAAFRRLCVETKKHRLNPRQNQPAAFRRLCVETANRPMWVRVRLYQPPSGGCVLKHSFRRRIFPLTSQPPSGGCVLKLNLLKTRLAF